jgi:tRNA(adenine34) deaminase
LTGQHIKAELKLLKFVKATSPSATMLSFSQDHGAPLQNNDVQWMQLALDQARLALKAGEVPVGAVVIKDGQVVGSGFNRNLTEHDPTAHAEIVALRQAAACLGNHRLPGCILVCTIEPCAMCAGAMVHARISRLIHGAADPKAGAAGSVLEITNHSRLNHRIEVTPGVLADQCSELLKNFFAGRSRDSEEPAS